MDDDTDREGLDIDEPEDDLEFPLASGPPSRRVRIIGAEQAGSLVPPEGFAVTDDPLETGQLEIGHLEPDPFAADPFGTESEDDPLESFDEGPPLDLRWSSDAPAADLGTELPHWTDPPTGQVPAVLARDEPDLPEWQRAGDTGPVWREHEHDWADPGFEPALLADEGTQVGELRTHELAEERRPWEFDSAEGSEDTWREEDQGSIEVEEVVVDTGPSGPVTTISSSVRRVTQGQVGAPQARSRHGRRKQQALANQGLGAEQAVAVRSGAAQSARSPNPFDPPGDGGSGRNMTLAIATGVAVAALAILSWWAGPLPSIILATAVITLCAAEAYGNLRRSGRHPATLLGLVATVGVVVAAYSKGPSAIPLVTVLLLCGTMLWYLIGVESGPAVDGISSTVFVFVWVGVLGAFAALLLAPSQFPDRHGVAFFAGAVVASVLDDVGALVAGRWFGRHKLAPEVSPKKTWEGLIGGSVIAIVGSTFIVGHIHPWTTPKALLLGVVIAVVGPVGDLCESLIKRDLNLKDMGSVLPGHGGVLDRFDALLFALPATYFLVRLVHLG
jgi:phosphatidate cytidylyltransferase